MGTSSIFHGNNDKNPLLPSDYDEQNENMVSVKWKTVKSDLSKYVSSNGTHGSSCHIIRQAVRASGGAHQIMSKSTAGIRAAKSIAGVFAKINAAGIYLTLMQLGIQYEGKSIQEIFSRLVDIVASNSDFKEDIVAKDAAIAALSALYEYVEQNNMNLECLDTMPLEIINKAMKTFLSEYIWASIMKDLQSRIEKYMENVTCARDRESELKDYIASVVDVEYDKHGSILNQGVDSAVENLMENCLKALEGII